MPGGFIARFFRSGSEQGPNGADADCKKEEKEGQDAGKKADRSPLGLPHQYESGIAKDIDTDAPRRQEEVPHPSKADDRGQKYSNKRSRPAGFPDDIGQYGLGQDLRDVHP